MGRMTQFIGLPPLADSYLQDAGQKGKGSVCPKCQHVLSFVLKKEQYDVTFGMFEEKIALYKYYLLNGSYVREAVQTSPWSSGPMIFLKLVDENDKDIFVWSEEEIEAYL